MAKKELGRLEQLLAAGEGAYLEFKSPAIDIRKAGDGMAKVLKAVLAFSSTPGTERSIIVIGVVEGKTPNELRTKALDCIERRREVTGQPPLADDAKQEWRTWIDQERLRARKASTLSC